ncbi:LysR family transcriptional regulator [Hoeflea sp. CAU 1731]
MDRLDCIETFINVLESGSFSAAAKRMGTTQSTVSKRIAMLENTFGTSLFLRTTRRLTPTEDAHRVYEHARDIVDAYQLTRAAASNASPIPAGTLTFSAPSSMGRHLLMPIVRDFQKRYPAIILDIRLTERHVNLVEEGIEMALRIGELEDSSLRARSLGRIRRYAVASPDYLRFQPEITEPSDLSSHACLGYSRFGAPTTWIFEGESGRHVVNVECAMKLDDADTLQSAILLAMGVGVLPGWLVQPRVERGELEIVLPDYTAPSLPFNAIYPDPGRLSLRARTFLDFVAAHRAILISADGGYGSGEP